MSAFAGFDVSLLAPLLQGRRKIPLAPDESVAGVASHRPSGVQESVGKRASGTSATFRSRPPSAGITITVPLGECQATIGRVSPPARGVRRNAICRPSGDQAGCVSDARSVVRRRGGPVVPTSFT
jgi:hypothetical protein